MTQIRALRSDIRHWRRGRATARFVDVLGDAYIALFATLMFGSMIVNVVVNVRREAGVMCTSAGCHEARTLMPWVIGLSGVVVVLAIARLFGPIFVSPAVGSWLLPTPVDRASVLRPRLIGTAFLATVLGGLLAAGASTLGGFPLASLLAFTGSAALLSLAVVSFAALSQSRAGLGSRVLLWLLSLAVWAGLLVLALKVGPVASPPELPTGWVIGLIAGAVAALAILVLAFRRLGRLGRHHISPGGSLAPGLSGALATLDLALVYDVLLAHRWHRHDAVRSRRGGPSGPKALVWLDLVRLRRSPQTVILLMAAVVVPYAAETAGVGRVVVLIGGLAGFVAGLPLLSALRVVTRTPSLLRAMPFPVASTRMATLAVPTGAMALFGLATFPAIHASINLTWTDSVIVSIAVGGASAAAAVRWVTGRPPDYTRPLVSTPAGGVPTNLYGSVVRGFDVLLLTTAPLLIFPSANGALFSLVVSFGVLSYLTGRE
ncbi:MAG: hypothetical protein JWR35_692 [Marmoricola sp.]|nr:hypothetical protein [Marmoricola sp.]